jgi:hypothetical protein
MKMARQAPVNSPANTSLSVTQVLNRSEPSLRVWINFSQTAIGEGSTKAGRSLQYATADHTPRAISTESRIVHSLRLDNVSTQPALRRSCVSFVLFKLDAFNKKTSKQTPSGQSKTILETLKWVLLSSGLYRRPRNFTGSCKTACGFYHRSGIEDLFLSPCPEETI